MKLLTTSQDSVEEFHTGRQSRQRSGYKDFRLFDLFGGHVVRMLVIDGQSRERFVGSANLTQRRNAFAVRSGQGDAQASLEQEDLLVDQRAGNPVKQR